MVVVVVVVDDVADENRRRFTDSDWTTSPISSLVDEPRPCAATAAMAINARDSACEVMSGTSQ